MEYLGLKDKQKSIATQEDCTGGGEGKVKDVKVDGTSVLGTDGIANVNGLLHTAGGTMTGSITFDTTANGIKMIDNIKALRIVSGIQQGKGASVILHPQDYADANYVNSFVINAGAGVSLIGKPDKTLKWNSKNILLEGDAAAEVIKDTLESATTTWSSNELKTRFQALEGISRVRVVDAKPAAPELNTLYYVGTTSPYEIWMWAVKEGKTDPEWISLGTTAIDLSNYYTKEQADATFVKKGDISTVVQNIKAFNLTIAAGATEVEQVLPAGYAYHSSNAFGSDNKKVLVDVENDVANSKVKFSIVAAIATNISIKLFAIKNPDVEYCPYNIGQVYETLNSDETIETLAAKYANTTWVAIPDRHEWDEIADTDVVFNNIAATGVSLVSAHGRVYSSGGVSKFKLYSNGEVYTTIRIKSNVDISNDSTGYSTLGVLYYNGQPLVADGTDMWVDGETSNSSNRGFACLSFHFGSDGTIFVNPAIGQQLTIYANNTTMMFSCRIHLPNDSADRTFKRFKRTA